MGKMEELDQAIVNGQDKLKADTPLTPDEKSGWLAGAHRNIGFVASIFPRIKAMIAEDNILAPAGQTLDVNYVEDVGVKCQTGLKTLTKMLRQVEDMQASDLSNVADQDIGDLYAVYKGLYRLTYDLRFEVEETIAEKKKARGENVWNQKPDVLKDTGGDPKAELINLHYAVRLMAKSFTEFECAIEIHNAKNIPENQIPDENCAKYIESADLQLKKTAELLQDIVTASSKKDLVQSDVEALSLRNDDLRAESLKLSLAKVKDLQVINQAQNDDQDIQNLLAPIEGNGRFDAIVGEVRREFDAKQKKKAPVKQTVPAPKKELEKTAPMNVENVPTQPATPQDEALELTTEMMAPVQEAKVAPAPSEAQPAQPPAEEPKKKEKRILGVKVPKMPKFLG